MYILQISHTSVLSRILFPIEIFEIKIVQRDFHERAVSQNLRDFWKNNCRTTLTRSSYPSVKRNRSFFFFFQVRSCNNISSRREGNNEMAAKREREKKRGRGKVKIFLTALTNAEKKRGVKNTPWAGKENELASSYSKERLRK